ncbi:Ig-like domain-containing protein [Collinsella tanakaei]|uniref:Ig-like domain-containing protein n=1 Tax=Collinsella tanakaei TaxID=626935 RepID=UPI001959172D|nr:Ig-like domain-containing protein [Collinsella tanakaei]MBM6779422.1 Ig-like domain-containing protein [Collinsella tanakaei]
MKRMPVANFPAMLLTIALIAVSPIPSLAYADDAPEAAVVELESAAADEEAAATEETLPPDAEDEAAPADDTTDAVSAVDVDGSGWIVGPLGDLVPQASVLPVEEARTTELVEGQAVTFVGQLAYPAAEGDDSTDPVSANLLFPAGDAAVGDTVAIVFYAEGDEPVTLSATVVAGADGSPAGALVEVRWDGARLTLSGVPTGTANGRYEVIGAVASEPAEPAEQELEEEPGPEPREGDEAEPGKTPEENPEEQFEEEQPEEEPGADLDAKLEEELAAAMAELEELRAQLDETIVLDEDELADAPDATVYLPADDAATLASELDALAARLEAEDLTLDGISAARSEVKDLHEKLAAAIKMVHVDRTALSDAAAADKALAETAASKDGRDVKHGSAWTAPEHHDALKAALAEAKTMLDAKDASQNAVDTTADALAIARTAFEDTVKVAQVSRADLEKARAAAADADNGVTIAEDIFDVAPGARWATTEQGDAFNAARAAAKTVATAELTSLTQNDVDAATDSLAKATETFSQAIATKPKIEHFTIALPDDPFGDDVAYASPGNPLNLKPVFDPAASAVAVTWSSSNSKVARVDANGTVTAVSDGVVTITATTRAFPGVAESVTATRRIAVFGTGAAWDYQNTSAGVTVEGVPSGVTVECLVLTGARENPVTSLGKGDRAVLGVAIALVTPLDDTVMGMTFDGMRARIGIRTHDYDGQTVEVVLYGDDGRTYTYETVAGGGEVYLTIPTGGYFEVIAPIVSADGMPAHEQLPQTGDSSLIVIAAVGGAGVIAVIAGVVLALKKRRS